jgi:DNA polymerase III subunit epsilon
MKAGLTPIAERARRLIENGALILDTETTGLDNAAEAVEIAVLDMSGHVVFESFIKPRLAEMTPAAQAVHQIKPATLASAPDFAQLWPALSRELKGRTLVAYNAEFDRRILRQTCAAWADVLPMGQWALDTLRLDWSCLMVGYSAFAGYRTSLTKACTKHGIEPGRHSAASDCRAALGLLQFLAYGEVPAQLKAAA